MNFYDRLTLPTRVASARYKMDHARATLMIKIDMPDVEFNMSHCYSSVSIFVVVVKPDSAFEVYVDQDLVNWGNLLTDMT